MSDEVENEGPWCAFNKCNEPAYGAAKLKVEPPESTPSDDTVHLCAMHDEQLDEIVAMRYVIARS